MIKFNWNGIKGSDGKLQKASYGAGPWVNLPADVITIYGKQYIGFSAEVRDAFIVENNTDTMTDYFENDKIRVHSDHPLYPRVKAAMQAQDAHRAMISAKRAA